MTMQPTNSLSLLSGVPNVQYNGPVGLISSERPRLAGMLKAKIDSQHLVGDESFTVRELRKYTRTLGEKHTAICLTCKAMGKAFEYPGKTASEAEDALIMAHEEASKDGVAGMIKRDERHVFAWFSGAIADAKKHETFKKMKASVDKARAERGAHLEGDPQWVREQNALNDASKDAGIIGLMSDEAFSAER
jgi:hypothetical protein